MKTPRLDETQSTVEYRNTFAETREIFSIVDPKDKWEALSEWLLNQFPNPLEPEKEIQAETAKDVAATTNRITSPQPFTDLTYDQVTALQYVESHVEMMPIEARLFPESVIHKILKQDTNAITEGELLLIKLARTLMFSIEEEAEAKILAHSHHLSNLHTLILEGNRLDYNGAAALAHSPHLSNLQTLELTCSKIGNDGVIAFANSPHVPKLKTLILTFNRLNYNSAVALAHSPYLSNLRTLNLLGNWLGDDCAAALASSPHLSNLQTLNLGYNQIGDNGAAALASSPHLSNLQTLNLRNNKIGDNGAIAFAHSPHLSSLQTLILMWNKVGYAGAVGFATSDCLPNLQTLDLKGSTLSAESQREILENR